MHLEDACNFTFGNVAGPFGEKTEATKWVCRLVLGEQVNVLVFLHPLKVANITVTLQVTAHTLHFLHYLSSNIQHIGV